MAATRIPLWILGIVLFVGGAVLIPFSQADWLWLPIVMVVAGFLLLCILLAIAIAEVSQPKPTPHAAPAAPRIVQATPATPVQPPPAEVATAPLPLPPKVPGRTVYHGTSRASRRARDGSIVEGIFRRERVMAPTPGGRRVFYEHASKTVVRHPPGWRPQA